MQELYNLTIKELNLSRRTYHILIRNNIYTIEELNYVYLNNKLDKIRMFGEKSLDEISSALEKYNKVNPLPKITKESISSQIDIESKKNLSIEVLNLQPGVRGMLKKHGIITIDDLKNTPDTVLLNINLIGPKKLTEIRIRCDEFAQYTNIPAIDESQKTINIVNVVEPIRTVNKGFNTWALAIEEYFRDEKEIYSYILISRFGYTSKTLDEIATELGLTRERIRQIQERVVVRYLKHTRFSGATNFIEKVEEVFSEHGDSLSLFSLKTILKKRGLLGQFSEPMKTEYMSNLDLLETLICWLNIISNEKYNLQPIKFSVNISDLTKSGKISIRDHKVLKNVSKKETRKIRRKILFTGGITIKEASKILSLEERTTILLLKNLGFQKIDNEWFTFANISNDKDNSKIPLRIAGLKMLNVKPSMNIDSFHDGLRRYASRFYASIAPIHVIECIFPILGFEIKNSQISTQLSTEGILSKSEQCLVSAITKNEGIASFLEIAEEFFIEKLSLPAVSVSLRRSPIVEKVNEGFYKIRDTEISWQEIESAQKRQKRFAQDEEINHGLDGVVRMKITVNSYAYLTGVVGAYKIKELSGSWHVIHQDQPFSDAKIDEVYLWGLSKIFKELDLKMGDRIELGFNTWNRTMSIQKVNHENS